MRVQIPSAGGTLPSSSAKVSEMDNRKMPVIFLGFLLIAVFMPLGIIAGVFLPWNGLWKAAGISLLYLIVLGAGLAVVIRGARRRSLHHDLNRFQTNVAAVIPPRAHHID